MNFISMNIVLQKFIKIINNILEIWGFDHPL